ncbi:MAG: hypothetical protein FWF44_10370, partial [Defluviitaleaceae bacterium]|nr:hypothetical protein [Defluviitaleaceae bacterium]
MWTERRYKAVIRRMNRSRADPPPDAQVPARQPTVWRDLLNLGIKIAVIAMSFVLIFTFFYGF